MTWGVKNLYDLSQAVAHIISNKRWPQGPLCCAGLITSLPVSVAAASPSLAALLLPAGRKETTGVLEAPEDGICSSRSILSAQADKSRAVHCPRREGTTQWKVCVYIYTHTLGKYVRALLQIKLVYKYRICIIARALIYRDLCDMSRGCMED